MKGDYENLSQESISAEGAVPCAPEIDTFGVSEIKSRRGETLSVPPKHPSSHSGRHLLGGFHLT